MEYVKLNNGVQMPRLGFGVYKVIDDEVDLAISKALDVGYRLIDTAAFYGNEKELGRVLKNSDIPREDLFITTKVWNDAHGYEETLQAFEDSITRLNLEYLDLLLVHWPCPDFNKYIETYQALETLYNDKKVRAIGVCNFTEEQLTHLLEATDIVPVVNQVERHPHFQQAALQTFCEERGIQMEAWAPLNKGRVTDEKLIVELAEKYNKTPAQITLRWHLQTNWIAIPKSVTPSRINENFDIFDFQLSENDLQRLKELDRNERIGRHPVEMHML